MSHKNYASRRSLAVAVLISALATPAMALAPGDLDSSFGVDGKVVARVGAAAHDGAAAAMLPDGGILVAGAAFTGDPGYNIVLARFLPDGTADAAFGVEGQVSAILPVSFQANALAVQPDGKIVVAGSTGNILFGAEHLIDMTLARFNTDGSLDTGFGNGGVVITDVFNNEDRATAVVILPDGRILTGGWAATFGFPLQYEFVLARYLPDGQRDPSFGVNGLQITDFFGSWDFLKALAVQPDGKIVAVGEVKFTPFSIPSNFFMSVGLARFHPDGQLDLAFGEGGKVHTEFFDEVGNQQHSSAQSVALQDDGKIVIAGHTILGNGFQNRAVILARYLPDGSLDSHFGTEGRVVTDLGRVDCVGNSVLLQPDGRIVAAGSHAAVDGFSNVSDNRNFLVLRYHANGDVDRNFGSVGAVITEFDAGFDSASSVLQQTDGKLIAAGSASGGFGLARYLIKHAPAPKP
jgi:uncharacterized delta-60 repeat protein